MGKSEKYEASGIVTNYVKDDGKYWIEENSNFSSGKGNLFLMRKCTPEELLKGNGSPRCIGGVEKKDNYWIADILCYSYDEDKDEASDSLIIFIGSREEAIEMLWESRFTAD